MKLLTEPNYRKDFVRLSTAVYFDDKHELITTPREIRILIFNIRMRHTKPRTTPIKLKFTRCINIKF